MGWLAGRLRDRNSSDPASPPSAPPEHALSDTRGIGHDSHTVVGSAI